MVRIRDSLDNTSEKEEQTKISILDEIGAASNHKAVARGPAWPCICIWCVWAESKLGLFISAVALTQSTCPHGRTVPEAKTLWCFKIAAHHHAALQDTDTGCTAVRAAGNTGWMTTITSRPRSPEKKYSNTARFRAAKINLEVGLKVAV